MTATQHDAPVQHTCLNMAVHDTKVSFNGPSLSSSPSPSPLLFRVCMYIGRAVCLLLGSWTASWASMSPQRWRKGTVDVHGSPAALEHSGGHFIATHPHSHYCNTPMYSALMLLYSVSNVHYCVLYLCTICTVCIMHQCYCIVCVMSFSMYCVLYCYCVAKET